MGTKISTEISSALDYAHCRTHFYPEDGHIMPLLNRDISQPNYTASDLQIA